MNSGDWGALPVTILNCQNRVPAFVCQRIVRTSSMSQAAMTSASSTNRVLNERMRIARRKRRKGRGTHVAVQATAYTKLDVDDA